MKVNACKTSIKPDAVQLFECGSNSNVKHYSTRFFYNSSVNPKVIEASLARKSSASVIHEKVVVKTQSFYSGNNCKKCQQPNCSDKNVTSVVKIGAQHNLSPHVVHPVVSSSNSNTNVRDGKISGVEYTHGEVKQGTDPVQGLNPNMTKNCDHHDPLGRGLNPSDHYSIHMGKHQAAPQSDPEYRVSVNTACANETQLTDQLLPIYDINYTGVEEKFVNSIIHSNQFSGNIHIDGSQPLILKQWRDQSDFNFGFIPLGEQQMPDTFETNVSDVKNLIKIHEIVRQTNKPNFM